MASQERYFISWILPEPLLTDIEKQKQYISATYHTKSPLKSPAHITIIPPFTHTSERQLLDLVQNFVFDPFIIRLHGYGAFPPRVVYIQPEETTELAQLYRDFSGMFYNAWPGIRKNTAFGFHPHITIGNRDWSAENFEACWQEMKNKPYQAETLCTKISLLKLAGGKWILL